MDDRVNRALYGKTMEEMAPTVRTLHKSFSIVEMAKQIREEQDAAAAAKATVAAADTAQPSGIVTTATPAAPS